LGKKKKKQGGSEEGKINKKMLEFKLTKKGGVVKKQWIFPNNRLLGAKGAGRVHESTLPRVTDIEIWAKGNKEGDASRTEYRNLARGVTGVWGAQYKKKILKSWVDCNRGTVKKWVKKRYIVKERRKKGISSLLGVGIVRAKVGEGRSSTELT